MNKSPLTLTPESNHRENDDDNNNNSNDKNDDEEEDVDPYGGLFDDEQTQILTIKEQLEDPQLVVYLTCSVSVYVSQLKFRESTGAFDMVFEYFKLLIIVIYATFCVV